MTLKERIHVLWDLDKNGCYIPFELKPGSDGYFFVKFQDKNTTLHRLVYIYNFGEISPDLIVRHSCNNPSCINPNHLICGTHNDNVQDRVKAGRSAKGEQNGRAKLTVGQVKQIRESTNIPKRALARKYCVDPKTIRLIQNNELWT